MTDVRSMSDAELLAAIKGTAPSAQPPQPQRRIGYVPGVPKAGRDVELQRDVVALERDRQSLALDQQRAARDQEEASRKAQEFANKQKELEASGGVLGTEAQNKAAALTTTLQAAMNNIRRVAKKSPEAEGPGIGEIVAGVFGPDAREFMQSPERRDIAGSQFLAVDAALTLATGAAYTPSQLQGYTRSLFPTINDTPENIAAKRRKFEEIIQAGRKQAGAKAPSVDQAIAAVDAIYGTAPEPETEKTGFTTEKLRQYTPAENEAYTAFLRSNPKPDEVVDFVSRLTGGTQKINIEDAQTAIEGVKRGARAELNAVPSEDSGLAESLLGAAAGVADTLSFGYLPEAAGAIGSAITGDETLAQKAEENLAAIRNEAPGSFFTGQIAGGIAGSAALGKAAAKVGGKIAPNAAQFMSGGGRVAAGREAAQDVTYGTLYGSGSAKEGERASGALTGAAGALAGNVAGRALVGGVGRVISPKTDPDITFLRERGVRTTPMQSIGPRASRFENKMANTIPLVGDLMASARETSLADFNTAFLNEGLTKIGKPLPQGVYGTAAMKRGQEAFNEAYDEARAGMQFRPDGQYLSDLAAVSKKAESELDEDTLKAVAKIYTNNVERITKKNPVIDGATYKQMSSTLGKLADTARREQKFGKSEILADMQAVIDEAARRSSPAEAVAKLDAADEGYALFVRAENAARMRGGDTGMFTVAQLDSAVQKADSSIRSKAYLRGDALGQEFVEAGKKIIGSNAEGSPTAGRLGWAGSGVAAVLSPKLLALGLPPLVGYLPGVRGALSGAIAGKRGKTADNAAKLLRENKRVGTAIGAGLTTPALIGNSTVNQ